MLKDFRAPDFGDYDVLEAVLPAARKRGMKTICWFEDVSRDDVPNIAKLQEKDLRRPERRLPSASTIPTTATGCSAIVEDYARSYDIDGIMWGSERQGAFSNALGASHGGGGRDPDTRHLLLRFLRSEGQGSAASTSSGPARASRRSQRSSGRPRGQAPVDGYYVTLWRLMLRYPELLAWEMLWTDSLRETYAAMLRQGQRSEARRRSRLAHLAQQLVQPHLPRRAGPVGTRQVLRFPEDGDVSQLRRRAHGELHQQRGQDHLRRCAGAGTARLPLSRARLRRRRTSPRSRKTGFSADYVYREAKRAREALTGTKRSLAGHRYRHPDRAATASRPRRDARGGRWRRFAPGADGVMLSRKYSEMKLANLRGAGAAVRQLGLV